LRNALIATLSELGDSGVIEEAGRRYAAQATDPSAVPGPLRKIIIGVVAAHADGRTWDSMRTVAQNEKNPLMRDYLYSALAMAEDEALAKRALDLSLTSEPGETTGAGMIRTVAFRHPDLAFDFAYANIDAVLAKVDSSSRTRFFSGLTGQSSSPAMITKLNEYAQKYLAPGSRREAEAAATAIGVRIGIRKERLPLIDQWLESRVRT
jgi:aminopeptidase N